jgi:hypothetical protein
MTCCWFIQVFCDGGADPFPEDDTYGGGPRSVTPAVGETDGHRVPPAMPAHPASNGES